MDNLQIFNYGEIPVRTVLLDGEPWWVLGDVCRVLDLGSPHKVADRLDPDEKGRNTIPTPGGNQNMAVINEPGLYKVILQSRKPEAREFSRWVTHEVLPAIRKTGHYGEAAPVEETTVALVNHETLTKCASIMASCLEPNRSYVLNILRHIVPDLDQPATVTVRVDEAPVEIPKLPAPEAAVVTTTKRMRKSPERPFFNHLKLQQILKERHLKTVTVAERIGCSQEAVRGWMSGKYPPTNPNREKLCAALGVAPAYFDK